MVVDGEGNVYVSEVLFSAVTRAHEYITIKYDAGGGVIWEKRLPGYFTFDHPSPFLALGPQSNLYLAGTLETSTPGETERDYLLVKYSSEGTELWRRTYDFPEASGFDEAYAIAVDELGNAHITGSSWTGEEREAIDYATLKYDPEGKLLWERRFDAGQAGGDRAVDVEVDATGNVYVIGWGMVVEYVLLKYDPSGEFLWERRAAGPLNNVGGPPAGLRSPSDLPRAMAIDDAGAIYVAGDSEIQALTMKYDPSGQLLWAAAYDGGSQGLALPSAMALGQDGRVFIAGSAGDREQGHADLAVWSYIPTGTVLFMRSDATADGTLDLSDAVHTLTWLFGSGSPPACREAADANGDGAVDIADPVFSLGFLFLGTAEPPPPFRTCAAAEPGGALSCERFPPCWNQL